MDEINHGSPVRWATKRVGKVSPYAINAPRVCSTNYASHAATALTASVSSNLPKPTCSSSMTSA